jgi:FkbM family methyltransferase
MMGPTLQEYAISLGFSLSHINQSIYITKENQTLIINSLYSPKIKKILKNFDYYFSAVDGFNFMGNETINFSSISQHKLKNYDVFQPYYPSIADPYEDLCKQNQNLNCQDGENVLDVGAYAGISSVYFSKKIGKNGKIISIEPNTNNFECLNKNIEIYKSISSLNNISVIQAAIWSESGFIDFACDRNLGLSPIKIVGNKYFKSKVQAFTLSQISSEYNLKSVDKIKINSSISKAEILSDGDFFQTFKPTILTEIKSNEKYLFNVLEKYGYKHSPVHELKIDLPLYIFSI